MRALGLILCLWPLAAPAQEFTTLKGHGGPIMAVATAPNGQVATASFDNSVGLWEARNPRWLEGHEAAVVTVAFAPDGTILSGGDDFTVRLWGAAPRVLGRHEGKVTALAVSPSGAWAASASWDGSIRLWPLVGPGEPRVLATPGSGVNAVVFGSDTTLFAGTVGGEVLRYDVASGAQFPLVKHGFGVNRVVLGAGWLAYGAVDGGTRVVDPQTGAALHDFTLDRRPVLAMAHHAETNQLAVGDGHGFIMIIDTADWRITRDFRATRQGPVWALAFSPEGNVIYAGGLDDVVYAWPVALLDAFDPTMGEARSFLRAPETMENGERQFMRKCSICHALAAGPSRKAGPTLHGVFGRPAGSVAGYRYSPTLETSGIVWTKETINALFDEGPDHYIPGSKMPMQVIAGADDRADLIDYLAQATQKE